MHNFEHGYPPGSIRLSSATNSARLPVASPTTSESSNSSVISFLQTANNSFDGVIRQPALRLHVLFSNHLDLSTEGSAVCLAFGFEPRYVRLVHLKSGHQICSQAGVTRRVHDESVERGLRRLRLRPTPPMSIYSNGQALCHGKCRSADWRIARLNRYVDWRAWTQSQGFRATAGRIVKPIGLAFVSKRSIRVLRITPACYKCVCLVLDQPVREQYPLAEPP